MGVASEIIDLVRLIAKWAREGLNDEEIEARLNDPAMVGEDLLERIRAREELGRDLLGRER